MDRPSDRGVSAVTIGKLASFGCLVLASILLAWAASRPAVQHADHVRLGISSAEQPEEAVLFLPSIARSCYRCYFVDSISGSDSNSGTSEFDPWRTLAPVHATHFLPGSVVHLKRGSSWTGGLRIDDSGVEGRPIVFMAYGVGDRPVLRNPGSPDDWTRVIVIDGDWIVVEGLLLQDAHRDGVSISEGSNHNVVRDLEVTDVGTGISIAGRYNIATNNFVHDLHMVRNTPGGNDDFGAVGVMLHDGYNHVSYNTMVNCIAPSYDYGVDGGGVEWWGNADGNYVHHNWVAHSAGFLEIGGGSARDTTVAYNVSFNNGRFSFIHLDGQFASYVENFRPENNTIVETADGNPGAAVLGFRGSPTVGTFHMRNNVFYIDGLKHVAGVSSLAHDHNLYYLTGGTELGFPLGTGEMISEPLFVDPTGGDFHLLAVSPAIDAGIDLGYSLDFEDRPVPLGSAPDLGAYESGYVGESGQ